MANRIQILPEELANKIAAGEVVERPASVVKELVENAIDAGATEVLIDIKGGGRSMMRVVDNGSGMGRDDALLSLERHATSKIKDTEDLFNIRTLGFRGEALAAISGVSRLELVTRQSDAEQGNRVFAQGGVVRQVEAVGAPLGTSIEVRDLFFNTPARLKFLKSAAVETGHIIDMVIRLALSHDGVGFTLLRGPETLVRTDAAARGRARLSQLLGPELLTHLFPFRGERGGLHVSGYLSGPEINRSGWSGLYCFVNKRFMRDRLVSTAVGEAYRGSIPKGRYPTVVLFLELDPSEVDVNVHPGKIEVRFARPRTVSELIISTLKATLLRTPWKRVAAGLGVPLDRDQSTLFPEPGPAANLETPYQLEQAELLRQELLEEVDGGGEAPDLQATRGPGEARLEPRRRSSALPPDPDDEAARLESLIELEPPAELLERRIRQLEPQRTASVKTASSMTAQQDFSGDPALRLAALDEDSGQDRGETNADAGIERRAVGDAERSNGRQPQAQQPRAQHPQTLHPQTQRSSSQTALESGRVGTRVESPGLLPGIEVHNFSRMRVIGQYANCFILCQDADELVIIDQHAAHERVTFEQLRRAYEGLGARSQLLLTPCVVELPRREAELLTEHLDALRGLGLEVEPFGGTTYAVKSLPVPLRDEDPARLLLDLVADLSSELARQPLHERIYLMLATMACHGSIRANRKMNGPEMEALLRLLDGTDFNYACPHGRPLIARSSRREVERLFKRT